MRLIRRGRTAPMSVVPGRGVRVTRVDDGYTLIDARGRVLHLNITAAVMLDALVVGGLDGAVSATRERFGVGEDTARADAARLLRDLLDRKVVRWA
ncbi:PqqD family protein [Amycolatopsis cihanbeyliensis]|uniref:Coenzyme PQQ synthesis protein D (PqqD) n=1 Tax=Amycolatopsis cihanbeyliensis TaxID=1128664 RepID=A0A542DDX7_AMYCI|nr:PqqD family protein [Amycolatopsis cihanbeyliensis]TQJ01269.1 coenzyme PQQ synthesis protein D (PqqD) [Amycolatopsis cihanbeyliensis]